MHDPMTVGMELPNLLCWHKDSWLAERLKKGTVDKFDRFHINAWRPDTLLTIWHVDPELNGNEDSCGFSTPHFDEQDKKLIEEFVSWEMGHPYFTADYITKSASILNPEYRSLRYIPAGECLALVFSMWTMIAWRRDKHGPLTNEEIGYCISLATSSVDNLRQALVRTDNDREQRMRNFTRCVFRAYKRYRRPWYKHPRWHIHHWKLQIHPLQQLRRVLFDRCQHCNKGFKWNAAVCSNSWHTPKHYWWQTAPGLYHGECDAKQVLKIQSDGLL